MANFFRKKLDGLKQRWKRYHYGIYYLFARNYSLPEKFNVNGKKTDLHFKDRKSPAFVYEFDEICLNDCYHLKDLKQQLKRVDRIIDIGANQGLFLLAARQNFPNADITCYEPNKELDDCIGWNAKKLNAKYFLEAVTKEDCLVQLNFAASDLHTTSQVASTGNVIGTSFKKLIERAGEEIDIIKMDCEGAEWDLFGDPAAWNKVRALTMEYHLWANKGKSANDVVSRLNEFGMVVISEKRLTEDYGLITAVRSN